MPRLIDIAPSSLMGPRFASALTLLRSTTNVLLVFTLLLTFAQSQQIAIYLQSFSLQTKLVLIGLGAVGLLEVLLPIAAFIGSLLVFRRAWRCGYCLTVFACGRSPLFLLKGALFLSIPLMCITAFASHSLGPDALRTLRRQFIEHVESGARPPLRSMVLESDGAIEFLGGNAELVGVLRVSGERTLVHADSSTLYKDGTLYSLQLQNFALNNPSLQLQTKQLKVQLPIGAVTGHPKVLRGTKLIASSQLDFNRSDHVFSYARRWCLTLSVPLLILYAFVLPAFLSDFRLAIASLGLLGSLQSVFRGVEIWALSSVWSVSILFVLFFGLSIVLSLLFFRNLQRA